MTEPVEVSEADRIEWVPLVSVPELIAQGQIWNSGVLIGLPGLLGGGLVRQPDFAILGVAA